MKSTPVRMLKRLFNLRYVLIFFALLIVLGTFFYTHYLSQKIQTEERVRINQWVEANKFIATSPPGTDITLASLIQQENKDIPVILTDEKDSIIDYRNLDEERVGSQTYLLKKLNEFKHSNPPIDLVLNEDPLQVDHYYYGESSLLVQIRYFPIVQLLVVALFIYITIYSISVRNKSEQNRVWAGLARETAHQLGTPLTSLQGWIEILRDQDGTDEISDEMSRDVERLKLISNRFGKIGSKPSLEEHDIIGRIENTISYIRRLAPEQIKIQLHYSESPVILNISATLFDWVIENLLKNALDSMSGSGHIDITVGETGKNVWIDIKDTGRGVSSSNIQKIFRPGFTTKKRGWGLGLSLCQRIIEQYHQGQLVLKDTEVGKGTTFRVVLKKEDPR